MRQQPTAAMTKRLNTSFKKINCTSIDHRTPFDTVQKFVFCSFQKLKIVGLISFLQMQNRHNSCTRTNYVLWIICMHVQCKKNFWSLCLQRGRGRSRFQTFFLCVQLGINNNSRLQTHFDFTTVNWSKKFKTSKTF